MCVFCTLRHSGVESAGPDATKGCMLSECAIETTNCNCMPQLPTAGTCWIPRQGAVLLASKAITGTRTITAQPSSFASTSPALRYTCLCRLAHVLANFTTFPGVLAAVARAACAALGVATQPRWNAFVLRLHQAAHIHIQ